MLVDPAQNILQVSQPYKRDTVVVILRKIYGWYTLTDRSNMIYHFAQSQASDPRMWGNCIPTPEGVKKLAQAFIKEWTIALLQMLRHWHKAPCRRMVW